MEKHHYVEYIPIPIYPGVLILIFSNDLLAVKKTKIISEKALEDEENIYSCTYYGGKSDGLTTFIICFNFWSVKYESLTIGAICHEVNHCGNNILHHINAKPNWDNDEQESYLKGWIGDQIQKMMIEHNIQLEGFKNESTGSNKEK